ncbi:MAG: septal ring lytic transglycosylase RlpA family protein [Bacteroidota bacterium]|nr:septal ring lytic transglycosylase RlpA family protein [Bacteroidota bacterium]
MRKIGLFLIFLWVNVSFSQTDTSKVEYGIASFYAKKFEGRKCTSGQIFRNDSLTGAHKTYKFGTLVRITNLKNDSTVIVRINDRLPKKSKRSIDVTLRAAKQLNFIKFGLTKVRIEVLSNQNL